MTSTVKYRQLMRHFIEDALYNPINGYFVKHANIFHLAQPLAFNDLKDMDDYQTALCRLYKRSSLNADFYQLWHTPSELFYPFYSEAVGRYMLGHQTLQEPIIIYEVGPGTGTFCKGLTDFLRGQNINYEYHLIEISPKLHVAQKELFKTDSRVFPRHISFFDTTSIEKRPCFIVALEVWDNLAQDIVSFSSDGSLLQGIVEVDENAQPYDIPGLYNVVFESATDPLLLETFNIMDHVNFEWKSLKWSPKEWLSFVGYDQSFKWQYIPSKMFEFLKTVKLRFPNSKMIVSDFDRLTETTPGFNAPVVQTRYNGDTVACSNILLKKGLFDIFFPTDFQLAARLCKMTTGRTGTVVKHKDFLKRYGDCSKTETKSGYNPMLEEFENVSFLLS